MDPSDSTHLGTSILFLTGAGLILAGMLPRPRWPTLLPAPFPRHRRLPNFVSAVPKSGPNHDRKPAGRS